MHTFLYQPTQLANDISFFAVLFFWKLKSHWLILSIQQEIISNMAHTQQQWKRNIVPVMIGAAMLVIISMGLFYNSHSSMEITNTALKLPSLRLFSYDNNQTRYEQTWTNACMQKMLWVFKIEPKSFNFVIVSLMLTQVIQHEWYLLFCLSHDINTCIAHMDWT